MFDLKFKYLNKFVKCILIFLYSILFITLVSCYNHHNTKIIIPAVTKDSKNKDLTNEFKVITKDLFAKKLINKKLISIQQANNLANLIHSKRHHTFYCNCCYKNKTIDLHSCGYKIQKNQTRAERLEWEHIVPVSRLAKNLTCWNTAICCNEKVCYKGRNCCQKIDPYFLKMATDLHNIVPEIGELNLIRSNYEFTELPKIKYGQFGACKFKIDRKHKKVEANKSVKGIIARTYLYMNDYYNLNLSLKEKNLFNKWNNKYPPNSWEKDWNKKVYQFQHTDNKYISEYILNK